MSFISVGIIILIVGYLSWHGVQAAQSPKLNPFIFSNDLTEGLRAKVVCSAYLGDQPLDFRWLKDGRPFSFGRIQQHSPTLSELEVEPLKLEYTGNYTCVVTNEFGSDEATASLFVKAPPRWTLEPHDAKVQVRGRLLLNCEAVGSPPVQITWRRRSPVLGNLVDVISSERIKVLLNNSLSFSNILKSEDGVYICEATNGIGQGLQKSVQVVVYDFPVVKKITEHVTVERGRAVSLSCFANGDMPLFFTWRKGDKILNDLREFTNRMKFSETPESGMVKFTLTIRETFTDDEGSYKCTAQNEFGSDAKEIRLFLVEKPKPPEDVEVVDVWSQSARIRWSIPPNGNSPIKNYYVEYWSPRGTRLNASVSSMETTFILRQLHPFTTYTFHVIAVNDVGYSNPSEQVQFTTAKEEPSSPPTDLRVVDKGSTFIQLSWKPPPHEDWNGSILGYYVGYKQSSSKLPYTFNTVESKDDLVYYVLRGLKRGTRYVVSVKAFNEVGSSPQTQEISERTHSHEPPPRPHLMVKSIGSTHVQLHWSVAEELRKPVNSYTLNYRRDSEKWQEINIPDGLQNSFTLTNLESGVTYQIYLTSHTNLGMSEPSDTATVQTMAEPIFHAATSHTPTFHSNAEEFTQTLYIVVPVAVSTVIIVIVIVVACVYVYSKRPILMPESFSDIPPDKNFCYVPTMPRHHSPSIPVCAGNTMKQGSPCSTAPLTRPEPEEEEPIYESVVDEIRCKIKQRAFEEEQKKIGKSILV